MNRTRRLFLAACATGLLGIGVCVWLNDTDEPIATLGARPLPPTTAPVVPDNQEFVSFFAIGDTGATTSQRGRVIKQMVSQARRAHLQFVTLLGDNFSSVHWTADTLFAEAAGGFAWVLVTPHEMSIEMISTAGHRYTHRIVKDHARARTVPAALAVLVRYDVPVSSEQ